MRGPLALFLSLGVVAACSSKPPKPADPPAPKPVASAAEPAESGPSREERMKMKQKIFTLSCLSQVPEEKDFCACIGRELTSNLTLEELESQNPNPARMRTAQQIASKACPATESMVQSNYLAACLADRKEMQPYCDCTWTEFRKQFSSEQMGSDEIVQNEKFIGSRKGVVKACEKTMPEKAAQSSFMKGCAKNPANEPFCACAWKEARKLGSAAEIEGGVIPLDQIGLKAEQSCSKLRPKVTAPPAP